MRKPTARVQVTQIRDDSVRVRPDRVVTEEPLEVRIHGPRESPQPVAVTLRTPGNDFELAVGLCVAEGLLRSPADLATVEYCVGPEGDQEYNVVTVARRTVVGDAVAGRTLSATASCGVCGKATLDDLAVRCEPVAPGPMVAWSVLRALPARAVAAQSVFDVTGGLHATALFAPDGTLELAREDVGRHNALDKTIGAAFLAARLPLTDRGVLLSGRIGFELVQKAAMAGIGLVAGLGAPTSLAIETARTFGVTLVGFLRDDRANVYTGAERIDPAS
jgi:FdhD protein